MLPRVNPTQTDSWSELQAHFKEMRSKRIVDLFDEDKNRFDNFSLQYEQLLVDYSKNMIDQNTIKLLIKLADEVHLSKAIEAMFSGSIINETENRSVLHTALRNSQSGNSWKQNSVYGKVNSVLEKVKTFSEQIIDGKWKGFTGKKISDMVNIGIGGSHLGPAMVYEALTPYRVEGIRAHFVSNVDSSDLLSTLEKVNPETTLFIISSKSFTTQETMSNAFSARNWFLKSAGEKDVAKHFVAVSTNLEATRTFGIDDANVFEFWDWVGGRYSVWSSIGLSIACSLGFDNFRTFLDGAAAMDQHFKEKDFHENIPAILALISIWYTNMFQWGSEAILPYNHYLDELVDYLQQVVMESNGKSVDRSGQKVDYNTCPILWGSPGTNSQHSFFQLLHQGTHIVPCDFIAAMKPAHQLDDHQVTLLSNFFAQPRALMTGKSLEEVMDEMKQSGYTPSEIHKIAPHKVFEGNRPSNSILMDELNPYNLGMLLALYEHKVFVQGIVWNIFSFDQWGVELGKKIATQIEGGMNKEMKMGLDSSTNALISFYKSVT